MENRLVLLMELPCARGDRVTGPGLRTARLAAGQVVNRAGMVRLVVLY